MTMMRAKMRVTSITGTSESNFLEFRAVGPSDAYPEDGSDENNTFAKFTPNATLDITIQNPALLGKFKVGDIFYVDFTPAVL